MRLVFPVLRLAVAIAIAAAVIAQFAQSASTWAAQGRTDTAFRAVNFFSFFTIESNIAAAVVLVIGVVLSRRRRDSQWYTVLRAAIVTYMATTGVVYNLLLRGIELPQGTTVPWSNEVLHVIAPVALVLDWLLAPGRGRLGWSHLREIVAFPIVWAIYTLVRGPLAIDASTGMPWYPYPFLNPATSANGYLSVSFYVILIAAVIGLVGAAVIRVSRARPRRAL